LTPQWQRELGPVHARHIEELRARQVAVIDETLFIGNQPTMFLAERGLMRRHAQKLLEGFDAPVVLDVGTGLGVFAECALEHPIRAYVGIEPQRLVAARAMQSVLARAPCCVTMHAEPWQSVHIPCDTVDAIMLDTWPPDGYADADFENFVRGVALRVLRDDGRLSFFCSGDRVPSSRLAVLHAYFVDICAEPFVLSERPRHWVKPTLRFVVPVASRPRR
jgi:hypothetical protein